MRDLLAGKASNITGNGTFSLEVTQTIKRTHREYRRNEKVRINRLNTDNDPFLDFIRQEDRIASVLAGRGVMCLIYSRDASGCLESDVFIVE